MRKILLIVAGLVVLAACATSGGPGNTYPAKYQVRVDTRYCTMDEAEKAIEESWEYAQKVCPVTPLEIAKGQDGKGKSNAGS